MIANGNQTIDGMTCRPVMIEPTPARSGGILATKAPSTVPITSASPYPSAARRRVIPTACHSSW